MEYKNWFIKFLFLFYLLFLSSILLNYLIDPYQIYHKNKFGFLPNERYQVAGLIESYLADKKQKLDSIIVGTSMSQNFIPQDVTDNLQFGGTLKLTISGSSPIMKNAVIDYAMQTAQVKNAVLEIFESYAEETYIETDKLPLFLYETNNIKKFKNYIFNIDILKKSVLLILNIQDTTKDLNKYQYWMDGASHLFARFNTCENLDTFSNVNKNISYKYTEYLPQLDMLIKQIKENKDVKFFIFFPPYSRLYYYEMQEEKRNKNISMRRYLLQNFKDIQNVKIFAFDNLPFVSDLKNYKDKAHYSADINKEMLHWMAEDRGLVTLENIDAYENNFIKNLINYKIYTSSDSCDRYKVEAQNYE